MKPISLQMQAFGPFAGKEAITFSDLGESPLFLINGPTGSGKTTILDAISYALYGSTTGNERDARDMRCQQSDPELLTEVTFEFSLGGTSYRITRSPDQFRLKKRGEGVTPHQNRADLYKLGQDGSTENGELLVEKKVNEATDYIRSITGLNAEQFRQVMVLPQGQFRKLLMADSKERQSIFQSLFQTSIYSTIEDRLKDDSKEITAAVAKLESVIRNILESGGVQTEQDLEEKTQAVSEEVGVLKVASDKAHSIWAAAEKALHDANKLKGDFDELDKVKGRESQLNTESAQILVYKERAKLAHSAVKLMPVYRRVTEAEAALLKTQEEMAEVQSALADAEQALVTADSVFQTEKVREPERAAAGAKVHELKSYSGKAEELAEAKQALEAAQAAAVAAESKQGKCTDALEQHLAGEATIQASIDSLHKAIAAAEGIDLKVHKLTEALRARKHLSALRLKFTGANKAHLAAQEQLAAAESARDSADKELKRLRQTWHQGQAALLALELDEGSPCPVCGSTEHPSPAVKATEMVTDEELEAANTTFEAKTQLVITASGAVTTYEQQTKTIEKEIEQSEGELGKQAEASEDDIATELTAASGIAAELVDDREKLAAEQQAIKNHAEQAARLRETVDTAKAAVASARQEVGKAQTRFDLSEKALPAAYRAVGQLEKELATATAGLEKLAKALQQAQQTLQAADKARAEAQASLKQLKNNCTKNEQFLANARSDWAEALAPTEFKTEQEVQLAFMADVELVALDNKTASFDRELLEIKTTRATLEKQLDGKVLGDLPGLAEAEEKTRNDRDSALEAWRSVDRDMTRLIDTKKNLISKQAEMASLDAKYRVVGTLAEVACGTKGAKISLQRYVLGVLLDEVLVQSSQRLMKMSDGRYELRRKLDPSRGNRASGLDLEVYDDYSGESRSVSTLSGGESFMAALSLALGLSDVVQAQTGGIQLDTLFVDEGFGTLDSEALELAVSTLMDLQRAGRMVGIISHVSELKEQMDIRIDLTKSNQGGSSLKVVSPMMSGA
jgi:DNA repair protein SbcC/Rad50